MLDSLIVAFYSFARSFIGIITRPYETYRKIIDKGTLWELFPIGALLSLYFGINALVKVPAFRPFVLTRHFVKTSVSVVVTAFLISFLFWGIGRVFGGKGQYKRFFLGWSYTLIPTFFWFLFTSLLYVIVPPPRTTHPTGIALSIVFLTLSAVLFFWKIILSYLTLRFGLKLDLLRILGILLVSAPVIGLYSIAMYRLGIFRVPFL
jgi:hypothetical protein